MSPLETAAVTLSDRLRERAHTLVLAESCTGGLAAAALVGVSGASDLLAGSFVTYQTVSKAAWLGVSTETLGRFGPVSGEVAAAMAAGAAVRTPGATIAAAITGHLGPDAPPGMNGLLVVGLRIPTRAPAIREFRLPASLVDRGERQAAAAAILLTAIAEGMGAHAD